MVVDPLTLSALAEPHRLRIVELLRERPRAVGEITRRLRLRQPQVSKHLQVLSRAGIVEARPMAQRRVYRLRPAPFEELDAWLGTFRPTWNDRLDALEDYLAGVQRKPRRRSRKQPS
jgi:DNA-binding transcriptional ArsR family regulator